jgi:hypothetical protein
MSLDFMDVLREVESEFEVRIPDRDVDRIRTVGDLHQLLLRQRDMSAVCPSSATFYRARRALCRMFGLPRRDVCPVSRLDDLIPVEDRPGHWQRFRQALDPFDLPDLQRPPWLRVALPVALWLSIGFGLSALLHSWPGLAVLSATSLLVVCLAYLHTRPLAVCIPAECDTMRGLVGHAVGEGCDRAFAALRRLSEREVWDRLRLILGENLGVDADCLTPDTDFSDIVGC